MKKFLIIFSFLFSVYVQSQTNAGIIAISKTFSEDGKSYLESIPFNGFSHSTVGKTKVYKNDLLLYSIDKPFTTYRSRNYVGISNDAQYIIYIIAREHTLRQEKLKNVTIYKSGKLIKSYTTEDFSDCYPTIDKCSLVCDNGLDIVDEEKSVITGKDWIYYEGVTAEQIMLFKYPVFMKNDTIYCTNSKEITTVFDLKNQKFIERVGFEKIYSHYSLKDFWQLTEHKKIDTPIDQDENFPKLKNGQNLADLIAKKFGLKALKRDQHEDAIYEYFHLLLKGYIDQKGKLEITNLEAKDNLPYEEAKSFIENQTYDVSFLPAEFDKFFFTGFNYKFRDINDNVAIKKTQKLREAREKEREKRSKQLE